MTIKLNNAAIEQLKKSQWQEVENDRKITGDFSTSLLREITGLNADILNTKIENAYYEATYTRTEVVIINGENEYSYNLCIGYLTENHDTIFSCYTDDSDTDFLELFTEKEPEKTDDEKFIDYLRDFIGERPDGDVIELIKQNLTDFWNNIVTDVMENAEEDDLTDDLKDEVGRAWAENNPLELKELFLDNASSYELKEMATDIINDYL